MAVLFAAVPKSHIFLTLYPPGNYLCVPDSSVRRHVPSQGVYDCKIISVAHFMNARLDYRQGFR